MGVWTSRPSAMFGGKITDHLDKDGVNKFVKWSVEEIEKTGQGLKTDALYRASGGHDEVQRIRVQPERGMRDLLEHERNVHVLTGALKLFFRNLKLPILRIEEFQDVLKARKNGNDCSDHLVLIIKKVPKLQMPTLRYFFRHIFRVMHEFENNMSLASLGVVFGPTLLRVAPSLHQEDVASLQASIEELNLVVELLLQHYAKVFDDPSAEPATTPPSSGASAGDVVTEGFVCSDLIAGDGNPNHLEDASSIVEDAKEDHSGSLNEDKELELEAAHVSDEEQPVLDSVDKRNTCDGEVVTAIPSTEETPSLAAPTATTPRARNSKSTSSTISGDFQEDSSTLTHPTFLEESTRKSSSLLDDPMCKSSDSEDFDSVFVHVAKAFGDVERLSVSGSSGTTTSRESSDVTAVEVLPDRVLQTTDTDTESPDDDVSEKSAAYHLSAPRISIVERDLSSSVRVDGEPEARPLGSDANPAVVEPNNPRDSLSREVEIDADPDVCSVQDKIRLFTNNEENVSSLKKQKSVANGESEEDKKVKTEFEETFEKVTNQKK